MIDVESGQIFAQVEGEGKPIVLLHGFALTHEMWKYQVPSLKNNGYKVVAIDLRGFGSSKMVPGAYTYDVWANDLGVALDELHLQHVTLAGFTWRSDRDALHDDARRHAHRNACARRSGRAVHELEPSKRREQLATDITTRL